MVKKYFEINNPKSKEAEKVVKNNKKIDNLIRKNKIPSNILKENSVNLVVLLQGKDKGNKACNYNCDICYTKDRFNEDGLIGEQIIELVSESKKLGAKGLYIPGIGEPTKSKAFWKYLKAEKEFPTLIFTNGSYIYDQELQNEVGLNLNELLDTVKESNLHQYVKFWTTDKEKAKKMYGVEVPYVERNGTNIPYALDVMLDNIPKDRLGVEVALRKDNIDEIEEIVEFCERELIRCFIEPVIDVKWAPKVQLSKEEILKYKSILAISDGGNYCKDRASRDLVVNINTISPCIVFPKLDKYSILENEKVKPADKIFEMFHDESYRQIRTNYGGNCICSGVLSGEIQWS